MKLIIRSLEAKQIFKIEIPSSSCTLEELKNHIFQALPSTANSSHLSLNRKDELQASEEDTLQSMGITSGDLIYYTHNPIGVSISTETHSPKSFSVPGFLRKVFTKELNDDDGSSDHKLLVVAVHAVFVESGFVLLDPLTFTEVSVSQFLKYRSLRASRRTLFYTLPEVIDHVKQGSCNVIDSVEINFQSSGKSFIADGSLSGAGEVSVSIPTRRVTLNKNQLVPFLNVVYANCGLNEVVDGDFVEKEVCVFWRNVKDGLVLPLLIDLCEKSGLVLPPCFTGLPNDLKLKILESLPGVEIARVSCLSSELRNLGSSDDLWKKKYVEQFGNGAISGKGGHWKEKFAKSWGSRIGKFNVKVPPTCPRCDSTNTKFCYFNNYSFTQPRYFCKGCRRYWTKGGSLRNVPIGGGCRKRRRGKSSSSSSSSSCTSHQDGRISRNLGHGVCLNHTNIDHNQSNSNSLDHHGPNIDLALGYANFLNSDNSKPSQLEDFQNLEVSDDLLLPNQGVLVAPAFEFSSVINNNMEFLNRNLGQESRLIGDGDGVYFSGIHEETQDIMNHSDVHDDHYTNMNNVINHDQLGNNYMELPLFPSEEMIWSNSHDHHDHMVFPNDILNTSHNLSIGGLEPELAVQDPSQNHNENNANDGSVFNLSNFGNSFRP